MAKTSRTNNFYDSVNEFITIAKQKGLVHLYTAEDQAGGRTIQLQGHKQPLLNFGSCSYLGLEHDERIIQSGIAHLKQYGSQFSSSRSYVSIQPYQHLEELLTKIFQKPLLLSPNSTMGHMATLPAILEKNDAVIIDHQAHISMHHGLQLVDKGISITLLRHSHLQELEQKIETLKNTHNRIWYVMDGIYSMYGDVSPAKELITLLNKHPQLHLYVDDAHGMSWTGIHGQGYFLNEIQELHPKMILATSLAKSFGSAGGVFIFPNEEWLWKVRTWGGPLTYSGPQQPATIGCSIASAHIHLSDELPMLQEKLMRSINLCNELCAYYQLPLVSNNTTPIKFIGAGLPKVAYRLTHDLMQQGFYVNLGIYPAVPETCSGIRFTVTNHHTHSDIERLCKAIHTALPYALLAEDRSMNDVYRAFKTIRKKETTNTPAESAGICLESCKSIKDVPTELWNTTAGQNGMLHNTVLEWLEKEFGTSAEPHHQWQFRYYLVFDKQRELIAATVFTLCMIKNDMLSPEELSEAIEHKREKNPYYQTSLCFMMGSVLTEGDHLYVNKKHSSWKKALSMIMDAAQTEAQVLKADSVYLRDFEEDDTSLGEHFLDIGFVKIKMPNAHHLPIDYWEDEQGFLQQVPQKKRNRIKKEILQEREKYTICYNEPLNDELLHNYYALYLSVKQKNLKLNTFALPFSFFSALANFKACDRISLYDTSSHTLAAIGFSLHINGQYYPWVLGLNYTFQGAYRQLLYSAVLRAKQLTCHQLHFGFTADEEKGKLNTNAKPKLAFVQMNDNFNMNELHLMEMFTTQRMV